MEDNTPEVLHIDLQKAVDLFAEARKIRGDDFNYIKYFDVSNNCKYVEENVGGDLIPGCAVGHVMILAGIDIDVLADRDVNDEMDAEGLIDHLTDLELIKATPSASDYLMEVQRLQDTGSSWGEAHRHSILLADRYYPGEVDALRS